MKLKERQRGLVKNEDNIYEKGAVKISQVSRKMFVGNGSLCRLKGRLVE